MVFCLILSLCFKMVCRAPEVNVSRREVVDTFVVSVMIVMIHEGFDLCPEVCRIKVIVQQDAVLEGLMLSLDLALGLGVIRCTTHMVHTLVIQPVCKIARDIIAGMRYDGPALLIVWRVTVIVISRGSKPAGVRPATNAHKSTTASLPTTTICKPISWIPMADPSTNSWKRRRVARLALFIQANHAIPASPTLRA